MLKTPQISVIMSVYNGEKYLKQSIDHILKQSFTNFEFIIVDDGSTDGSLGIIQSYNDNRLVVIRNEKRNGLTKSLNKALRVAKGEYVARQDADDLSLSHRFEEQLKFFEKHPKTVLLGTSVYMIDAKGHLIDEMPVCSNPSKYLLKTNEFFHGSVMFKRVIVDKLGGYNELFECSQDYELWLRLSKYYDVKNLQKSLYCWRICKSGSIGVNKAKDQFLFAVLARKIAKSELNCDAHLKTLIDQQGITCIYQYLNNWEKIMFYESCVGSVFSGRLRQNGIGKALLNVYHIIRGKLT